MTEERTENGQGKGNLKEIFYDLRLYISEESSNQKKDLQGLLDLCETHMSGKYRIEVIDLAKQPERAQQDRILATPTLVKVSPSPERRLFGDLSDPRQILEWLGLAEEVQRDQV